ncbi:MAG: hypothetical protein KGZ43_03120 [Sulfuritalea sp.]|nr:hypothetical protein [Sulfuritalea sp.]
MWYNFSLRAAVALSIGAMALSAHAGRPMVVDDAGIVGDRICQLETWVQKNRDSTEYWAVPACNFTGNLEVALGGARITSIAGTHTVAVIQGKTLFKTLDTNGWGAGLVFGNQFNPDNGVIGDLYANVPVSFSFQDDRFLLRTNLGRLREKETRRHATTWGVGAEMQLTERTAFTSETFGQHRGKPFFQLGIRHWVVPDRVQLDASYGNRFGRSSAERFFSVGLVLFSDAILP